MSEISKSKRLDQFFELPKEKQKQYLFDVNKLIEEIKNLKEYRKDASLHSIKVDEQILEGQRGRELLDREIKKCLKGLGSDEQKRLLAVEEKTDLHAEGLNDHEERLKKLEADKGPMQIEIPNIDLADLDACGWQTYGKKEKRKAAEPGRAAWIYYAQDAPQALYELKKALDQLEGQPLVFGNMRYKISGDKGQFINREPIKPESAKK